MTEAASPSDSLSRRSLIRAIAVSAGALTLGFSLAPGAAKANAEAWASTVNAWIAFGADGTVTIRVAQSEMGQGVHTALPMLIAEELGLDWRSVRVEMAPVDDFYRNKLTGDYGTHSSSSLRGGYDYLRRVGAEARGLFIEAAAAQWEVPAEECMAANGAILHRPSGRRLPLGAIAGQVQASPAGVSAFRRSAMAAVTPKPRAAWQLIGTSVPRIDGPAKVSGAAVFAADMRLPGMLFAAVANAPAIGGQVRGFDRAAALAMPGVAAAIEVPGGVAVVASSWWQAQAALERAQVSFTSTATGALDGPAIIRALQATAETDSGVSALRRGDAKRALDGAARVVSGEYSVPFLAHATMEPMSCAASVTADGCDLWTGTQGQINLRDAAASFTGLPRERVRIHTQYLGGGFGRRYQVDAALQAMAASRAVGRPVLVLWSREADMARDIYRPAALVRLRAGLDASGKLVAWRHRVVGPSINSAESPATWQNGVDGFAVEGATDLLYPIDHMRVDYAQHEFGVPVGVMRGVGYVMNVFAVESLIDEVALGAKLDSYGFRRDLLAPHPRLVRVLDEAARMSSWGTPVGAGRGRGMALTECYGAVMAAVVEITIRPRGRVSVDRVVAAVDCGPVVNPAIAEGQVEGGIVFGLSGALMGEVGFKDGAATASSWDDYRVLRLGTSPSVEVRFLASDAPIGGLGEIGVIPMAPALANAIVAAGGPRLRSLPLSRHGIEVE